MAFYTLPAIKTDRGKNSTQVPSSLRHLQKRRTKDEIGTSPSRVRSARMETNDLEQKLARSFDIALAQYISSEGRDADTVDARGRLAARLVVLSSQGETDEAQLAANAVLYLRAFAGAMRLATSHRAHCPVNGPRQIALGPEMITALTEALDRCLDDLPKGAATLTVRDHLQTTLMEAVSRGERNVDSLRSIALEKLRNTR